ncbi:MAG TPA: hypothetical protein VL137_10690 [Polyangiaceae bacterium]|nr:hypothetical protein [Polyangiaceae bacterium]
MMHRFFGQFGLCLLTLSTFAACSSSTGTGNQTAAGGSTSLGSAGLTGASAGGSTGLTGGTAGTAASVGGASGGSATSGGNSTGGTLSGGGSTGITAGAGGQSTANGGMNGNAGAGGALGSGGASGAAGSGSGGAGGNAVGALDHFSFFVTSMKAMRQLSGSQDGFGGDLRYGEADGLTGADKICTEIAEMSMPGSSAKVWHAFLSTVAGPVNARDRIGQGPWYDRVGRLVANGLDDLLQERPANADPIIRDDLPNEDGVPNKRPDPTLPEDDNHHFLTGSDTMGNLYTAEPRATCEDWTSKSTDNATTGTGVGRPRIGFSFVAGGRVNWISGQTEGGCGAGITGIGTENGGSNPANPIVGSGGGYGGIYCFALSP